MPSCFPLFLIWIFIAGPCRVCDNGGLVEDRRHRTLGWPARLRTGANHLGPRCPLRRCRHPPGQAPGLLGAADAYAQRLPRPRAGVAANTVRCSAPPPRARKSAPGWQYRARSARSAHSIDRRCAAPCPLRPLCRSPVRFDNRRAKLAPRGAGGKEGFRRTLTIEGKRRARGAGTKAALRLPMIRREPVDAGNEDRPRLLALFALALAWSWTCWLLSPAIEAQSALAAGVLSCLGGFTRVLQGCITQEKVAPMHPGIFDHLLLIGQFELKRSFATRSGLLSIVTFAVVWCAILLYPIRFSAELLVQGNGLMQGFGLFDVIGFGSIQQWPIPEFGLFWHFALLIFPLLSITLAADQTCSDRERGTLRFIVVRSSRDRVFFGRFAGVMVVQALLIGAAALSTLALVLYRDAALLSSALPDLLAVTANLILAVLPFTAMMAALSAKVKSARQATVWAILIWIFLAGIIGGFAYYLPALSFLKLLVPGYQLSDLAQLAGWQALQLAYAPLLQSLILLSLGRWIMARQAL